MNTLIIETILSFIRHRMQQGCQRIILCSPAHKFIWFEMVYHGDDGNDYWRVECGKDDAGSYKPWMKIQGFDNFEEALAGLAKCIAPFNLKFPDNYQLALLGTPVCPTFLCDHTNPITGPMHREEGLHVDYRDYTSSVAYK